MAKPIWVIGSGGVNNAAAAKIITTTYFLLFFKNSESTTPILASKLKTTGNWKLIPKAKINLIIKDRYSFTFASSWIGKLELEPRVSNDKNQIRKEFKNLKILYDEIKSISQKNNQKIKTLSMGMSSDYKIAIEEGSNMVRIGSLIFGERD